jgi:hypothetical protein
VELILIAVAIACFFFFLGEQKEDAIFPTGAKIFASVVSLAFIVFWMTR